MNAVTAFRIHPWHLKLQRWSLLCVQSFGRRLGNTARIPRHLQTGMRGEFEAMFHLRGLGYYLVERRWRTPELRGDLDLIGWEGNTLCFVEVKARTARDFAPAEAAIDDQKKAMLRRMGRAYRRTLPREDRQALTLRFDVVSVYLLGETVEFELVRDAFAFIPDEAAGYHF